MSVIPTIPTVPTVPSGAKIKIPFGKVAAFAASLIVKARGGFTKEEGQQILAEFMELLADVLVENAGSIGQK